MDLSKPFWAIQFFHHYATEAGAREGLAWLQLQYGAMGGRILPPHPAKRTTWDVQAFFEDDRPDTTGWLPDGMRKVVITPGLVKPLGITQPVSWGRLPCSS